MADEKNGFEFKRVSQVYNPGISYDAKREAYDGPQRNLQSSVMVLNGTYNGVPAAIAVQTHGHSDYFDAKNDHHHLPVAKIHTGEMPSRKETSIHFESPSCASVSLVTEHKAGSVTTYDNVPEIKGAGYYDKIIFLDSFGHREPVELWKPDIDIIHKEPKRMEDVIDAINEYMQKHPEKVEYILRDPITLENKASQKVSQINLNIPDHAAEMARNAMIASKHPSDQTTDHSRDQQLLSHHVDEAPTASQTGLPKFSRGTENILGA